MLFVHIIVNSPIIEYKIGKYNVIDIVRGNLRILDEQQLLLLIEDQKFNLNRIGDY